MRGVTRDEHAAAAIARGDDVVELPGADVLDVDVDVGIADRRLHARQDGFLRQLLRLHAVAHEDRAPLVPRLDTRPDAHDVVAARVADDEQRARAMSRVTSEIRFDPDGDRVAEPGFTFEGETTLLADDGAGAVAADDIPGDHVELVAVALAGPAR